MKKLVYLLPLLILAGCAKPDPNEKFVTLANNFIQKNLELSPELATYLGDHRYDALISDYSKAGIQKSTDLAKAYLDSLSKITAKELNDTNLIDYRILRSNLRSTVFSNDSLKEYTWNPMVYNAGNLIYPLLARDFAPLKDRLMSVKSRLRAIPGFLEAAKANLDTPTKIHTETAILQNPGAISLVKDELNMYLDQVPELKAEFKPVQDSVIAAITAYGEWLKTDLLPKATRDFRIGEDLFRSKLRYNLESNLTKEEILAKAETELGNTQTKLYETALPLFKTYFPKETSETFLSDKKGVIKRVLDKLSETRPDNSTIVDQAKAGLAEITAFVRDNGLVTVPDEPVKIIVMPEFQRGVAVAYCDSPGPLEKNGETFYSISPTPADWDAKRVESFFREYNAYMLKNLTVHEAMPGHYLQLAHSNKFKAPTLIRAIYSSGPFVEGWATYAEQLMVEKGYGGPEVKMQQLKMRLRLIINAIIDQKIHTAGMTEKEAMDLMMNEGFQEEGEAAGKWRRACMSSTQLSTYFVGNLGINDIRAAWVAKHGEITDMKAFHDQMLSHGSPAPKYVKKAMGL
ncbi:MAG: DUF885 domain-containing protein [Bacteroidetes bacterium]|nr:DUF885 domain-containing protein [Bacteroidota bacterium]